MIRRWTLGLALLATVACTKDKKPDATTATAPAAAKVVNLYNWADYSSPEVLAEFTKKTGIEVKETNFSSNEEMLAKLQAGATGYDVIIPSDYMVTVMTKLGLIEELDKSKIPNAAQIDPKWLNAAYDPGNKYSLPYAWVMTGIAVNRDLYKGPMASWGDLFLAKDLKNKVAMLDDVRETVGAALKFNGLSLNATKPEDLAKAKATLVSAKENVKAFNATPSDLITTGEVAAAHMYSQEALMAARESGRKIEFVMPKEGGTLAVENVVIPKTAANREAAYAFINFLYEKSSNLGLVMATMSGPVVVGVKEMLPADVQANAAMFPTEETLKRCEMLQDVGDATAAFDRVWAEIKAASH
jgi:spermidine/putrescine transport system substrate-binding protein